MAEFKDEDRLKSEFRGIKYAVMNIGGESVDESFAVDDLHSEFTIMVAWEDRYRAMAEFLGWSQVRSEGGSRYIERHTPYSHPEFLDDSGSSNGIPEVLYATRVISMKPFVPPRGDGKPYKSPDNWPRAKFALLKLGMQALTYDIREDSDTLVVSDGKPDESRLNRYVTKIVKPSSEILGLQGQRFKFVPSGGYPPANTPALGTPGKRIPKYDLTLTWHEVPRRAIGSRIYNPNRSDFPADDYLGTVNSTTFAGCPVGTVLYTGVDIRPIRSALGERIFEVEYRFSVSLLLKHNFLYYQGNASGTGAGYYEVTTDGSSHEGGTADADRGTSIYDYNDLNDLFKVPA